MAHHVQTTINFVPANLPVRSMSGTADFYSHATNKQPLTVHDARAHKDAFTISQNGFQYATHTSAHIPLSDPTDTAKIKSDLYAEVAELLQTTLTPRPGYVKVASHTIRSALTDLNSEYTGAPGPARTANLDHTPAGAKKPDGRFVNVWRPLKPIKRDRLAVCDGGTLQAGDLLPIQMDYASSARAKAVGGEKGLRTTVGWEIAMATYSEAQRLYYLSDMGVEDVLLMRIFDSSLLGGVAVHASFEDPRTKDEEARESIEFRCLVFWEDEPLTA